jgi:hypothetical protein
MTADEMTLTQLHGLIDGNPDNPATEQLRAELERRKGAVPSAAALAA